MTRLFHLASRIETQFRNWDWEFCFIGGIALQRWGEPRVTEDVDITLMTGIGTEERYIDALLKAFCPRVGDAKEFALTRRVLLLKSDDGIGIDVAMGALPFEGDAISRATSFEFLPGLSLTTCSAEDLVVMKAFAERERDWLDVETILIRQQGKLDWPYILEQLTPLAELKESPAILDRLAKLRAKQEQNG